MSNKAEITQHPTMIRHIKFEVAQENTPPQMRLKGNWMIEAGFIPGQRYSVSVAGGGRITIEPIPQLVVDDFTNAVARLTAATAA